MKRKNENSFLNYSRKVMALCPNVIRTRQTLGLQTQLVTTASFSQSTYCQASVLFFFFFFHYITKLRKKERKKRTQQFPPTFLLFSLLSFGHCFCRIEQKKEEYFLLTYIFSTVIHIFHFQHSLVYAPQGQPSNFEMLVSTEAEQVFHIFSERGGLYEAIIFWLWKMSEIQE